ASRYPGPKRVRHADCPGQENAEGSTGDSNTSPGRANTEAGPSRAPQMGFLFDGSVHFLHEPLVGIERIQRYVAVRPFHDCRQAADVLQLSDDIMNVREIFFERDVVDSRLE